jgi:uncharacterized Zn finger protein
MGAAKPAKSTRFDFDRLRELAGAKAFALGEEYHQDEQVELLAVEPKRVLARVAGSEDYRTELTGRGKDIGGRCSCPAYADWGFCKHMVAVGLAANAADGTEAAGESALSRIRKHLETQSVDVLADMIVALAEQDVRLFRSLELAAASSQADDPKLEVRLRKAIDSATRTADFVDYAAASDWADGVGDALDAIEPLASGPRAELALKLVERAIERIEGAIESIDDSDGHCGALLDRAAEIHLAAASAARLDPVQLARDLFARETGADSYAFGGAAARYAEALGEPGLAEYRRLATVAWETLPPQGARRSGQESPFARGRLVGILDFFAERDGDIDKRIALRATDLSSPYRYLELAQFCLAQGRKEQAIEYAEEGLWKFEDGGRDERLVLFAADLLAKTGRAGDAETHLWTAFEKDPSLELYARLREAGGDAARSRAVRVIEARCARKNDADWRNPADLLIDISLQEKAFDEAWAAVRKFGGSPAVTARLARVSETSHPAEAVEVYQASVERLADHGRYDEAAELIKRMGKMRSAGEQAAYVAALEARHGRKRNFMKLLG